MSTKLPNTTDKSIQDLYSENPNLVTIQKAAQALKVSKDTLRRWEAKGKITSIRTTSGYRLYDLKTLSKTIKSKPHSEPVKPQFNPKSPIMLPVTAQTPLIAAKEDHHSFYEFTNLNPEIVKLPSQNTQAPVMPVKRVNDYSGFSRIQKSSKTASLNNLTPFKIYSVVALMIVFLSSLFALTSPYIPGINQTKPAKYISGLIQKTNKAIKPSQEVALTKSKPEVLAASSIAKEGKFLQLNLDTNVVGNLAVDGEAVFTENITAPNILYSLVAGNNISITGDAQNPTISSTVPLPGDATNTTKGIASFSSTFFTVTDGAVTIADGSITGDQIDDGTVTNTNLANSSITINAGSGLSGGGTVSLGGSITLTATGGGSSVSGVSTITGTANQVIASASTGDITLSLPQSIATTSSPEFANLDLSDLDANGVVFTTGAGLLDTVTTASTGECLLSNGAGAPTWGSCFSGSTSFTLAGDSGPNQSISSGDTLTINGDSNIATLGVDTDHFSITLASALTGINSIDTISVSSTALTFAGVGTISSTTTSAITLDSGTTGTVNLGTGNNAKTINLGTGTAGNIINIATDNTVADTLNIASALDTTILNGAIRIAALTTNGPLYTSGGNGTLNSEAQLAVSRGGTGQDFSSTAQGSLPYFSATGTFSALAPSTAGYVLTTQGAGANPTWTDAGSLILRWNTIDDPNANQTLAMADYTTNWNWATADTETAFSATADALTSGTLFNLSSTSTAGTDSGNSFLLDLSRSGTNSNSSHTAYGLRSQVTNTGTTSTNIAGYFSASGATTNYALYAPSGYSYFGDSVGIGSNAPSQTSKLAVVTTGLATTLDVTNNNTGSTAYGTRITKSGAATTGVGLYVTSSGATNNYAAIFDAGRVGIGDTTPDSLFDIEGAISGTPSSTGAWLNYTGSTFTDNATSGSGTATTFAANAFGQPTLAATNSNVTTTNAATVYIANAPATGSNQTITAPLALLVDSGNARFDGHVGIGGGFNNIAVSSTSVLGISEAYSGTSSFNHLNIYAAGAPSSSYGANLIGLNINADLHSSATAGITGNLISGYFKTSNSNTTQSVSTAYGLQVATATSAGGAITTNYGLFIDDQTVGSSDYGLRIDAADTQTLWVGGGADGTTASAGIAFGSSRDTNLYRSAADTLKTDDAFTATGLITGSTGLTITGGTASINASGSSSTTIGNTSSDLTLTGNHINASMTLTDTSSGAKNGLSSTISLNPSGSSASQFRANSFSATVSSGNVQNFTDVIRGVYAETRHLGTGSINIATGVFSAGLVLPTAATSFGTITEINAFHALPVSEFASSAITGTVNTARGIYIENSAKANSSWALTTQVGIDVSAMTSGSSDIGVRIAGADTYSLQLSSTAGTAASGITFGTDTNLYRSAADTLKTDDAFNVNGNLNITSAGAISAATGITSSGTITFSGLSADSGVYTTTGGQLTTTPPSSGTLGYWSRTGSTLSPANSGDAITTSGNISTTGTGTISSAGLLSGTAGLTITGATASLNASSNFNTNINTGTSTGAISIGNSSAGAIALSTGSTFGITTTTGSQTFTSANVTGTTTSSSYVFNSSSLTSGTALYVSSTATSGKTVDINASQTSGTVFNLAYGSAKTISGDLTGLSVDLNSGNVDATNQNITGVNFKIPTVTDTHTSGTKTLTGMLVNFGSGAGINQNGVGGTLEYVAGDFYMPALTQSAGTLNAYGTRVTTPATITTGGTAYGNYISATGVGAGTLSGLGVSSITGGSGTEYALNIGSGWDAVLRVGSTTVINGSGVTVEAGGGTGQSTYSTGDMLYASGANTLAKRAIGNSNEVLTVVGGVPTWATISGASCSNCLVNDPTSDQTIAPTGQGTTGLSVRQTSTASPTDDIFQVTSSDGATKYFYVDKDGNVSTSATAGQTLTLTPTTDTTALTLVGTNVSSASLQYINSKNASATTGILNMAYGAAQTLTGTVIGFRQDLSTNVTATNQSVTGHEITLPGATNTSGTQNYTGLSISGGSINENGGTATTFTGASITVPALTQTSGTLTGYGVNVTTPSSITTAGTAYGLNVAATGVGAGSLYGLNISNITAGAGTEVGAQIGSGWDTNLLFNDTSTRVAVADGGTITILDTAGNSLCTITDNGSVGDLACTGTIGGSGTVGFWSRDAGTGIVSPSNANDVVAISSNKTSTPLLNLTSTGATSNAFTLTGNSITTGNLASLTGTGFTTGEILDITGTWAPSDGSTNEAIDINITHSPTSVADTFKGVDLSITDNTSLANSVFGIDAYTVLSGNAAKTSYGSSGAVTSSSTTADTLRGVAGWTTSTGAITTGTRSSIGVYGRPVSTAASTGGTLNMYGGYFDSSSTLSNPGASDTSTNNIYGVYTKTTATLAADCTTNCTTNQYGLYVDNGTSDTDGTSAKYGIYINTQSGADTNYALYSAASANSYFAGNLGIGTTPSGAYRAQVSRSITSSDNSYDGNLSASATVSSVTDGYTYVGLNNYLTSTHSSNAATLRGIDAKAYFSSQMASEATVGVNSAYAIYAEKGITGSSPTGTISNAFGLYSAFYSSATGTPAVTVSNNYGLYITNQGTPSGSPSGISVGNAIGLYVAAQSGATSTNYAAVFAGGNVGIGDTSPASALTVGSGDLFQVNSSGAIAAVTGYTQASGAFAFSGGGNFSIDSAAFDVNTSGAISGVTTLTQSGLHTINQGSAIRSIDINDTAASPSTPVIDVNRTNNTGTPAITNAALYINDHSTNYLLGFETGTTDLLTFTGAGQLSLPVSGSGAGIILGGDANLYRSAADTLRTDDAFNVGGNFNVTAAGVISGATGLTSSGTINFSGLSASSGVYTDGSKNLTSTPPSSGTVGYWSRSGTTLSTANAGDNVTVDGTLDANGQFDIGDGGDAGTISSTTLDIDATGALQINSSGGAISIGNDAVAQAINIGTGAAARTITIGNTTGATALAFNSGTGSQTFTSSVATTSTTSSAFVFTANSLTSGTGAYISSSSLTTGKLFQLSTGSANTLTSGTLGDIRTTSTALTGTTGTGSLLNLDWSPGSSTTATGDLFALNIGSNGTTTGKLFNILDSSSSIFSVSETSFTTSLPTSFTSAGDVSIAYDLQFTNPTASYIKSYSALTIQPGDPFGSSNLTLSPYNEGSVYIPSNVATAYGLDVDANLLSSGRAADISSTSTAGTASGASYLLYLSRSGANSNSSHTAYGIYSAVSNTGTTNTDIAGYFSASGAITNYAIQTGAITSAASGTNYQLNLGAITGASSATSASINTGAISGAGTSSSGITLGANSSTATTNYGINIGAISGAGTTNYGINIAGVSGASTNYAIYVGSGSVNIQGLTASSAVYTDSNKNLTSTAPTSGTIGYWSRTGTTLSPSTSGDNVTTTGNISTTSSGTLTIAGATNLNGTVTLGDATADDITFTGYVASSILPKTDDTYDLGDDTHRWANIFLGGETLHLGTSTSDEGVLSYTTASNTLALNNAAAGIINIGTSALQQVITVGNTTSASSLALKSATNITLSGTATGTSATQLVLPVKTDSGDPTTTQTDGAMYYNSNSGKFRCYENSAWTDCIGSGSASPFTSTGGVITQTTSTDKTNLVVGESGDYGLLVSTSVVPTVDMVQITNGNAAVADGVDGLAVNFTTGDGSNPTNSGINVNLTSGGTGSGDVLNGINLALTGTSGTEKGINFADNNFDLDINATTDLNLGIGGTSALKIASTGITSIGNVAHSITDSAGALVIDSNSTSALNIGTGSNAKTVTIGNATGATALAFNSGTGPQTFTSQVASGTTTTSAFVMDATALNSGTGLYLTSDSITTGKLAQISTGSNNTLTTGTLLDLRSTATSLTGTAGIGSLMNLDWSPGSSTLATGDLFSLNIGTNGTTTGNLFNILDSGSSIFSISETSMTTSLPSNFTAPGDVAIAYDLNFTNPTASYIKSSAPLAVIAGETFNSSNLTLGTYNQGTIVLQTNNTTSTAVDMTNTTLTTGTAFNMSLGAITTGSGLSISTSNNTHTTGTLVNIASSSTAQTAPTLLNVAQTGGTTGINGGAVVAVSTTASTNSGARGLTVTANSMTTGVATLITANAITSGHGLSVASSSTGNLSQGLVRFNASGAHTGTAFQLLSGATGGGAMSITTNSITTGTALTLSSSTTGFSSGGMFSISKTGASGSTAFTGDIANIAFSHTFSGGTVNHTGNVLDMSRALVNQAGVTHTVSGSLLTIADSMTTNTNGSASFTYSGDTVSISRAATRTTGTIANSGNLMTLTSSDASHTGNTLSIADSATHASGGSSLLITASAITSGQALALVGPSSSGVTGNFINAATDVGSGGSVMNLSPDFSGSAVTGYGLNITGTETTNTANAVILYNAYIRATGNAAKTIYGIQTDIGTSSTTADFIYGGRFTPLTTGAISAGIKQAIGAYGAPAGSGTNTGGTAQMYGFYANPSFTAAGDTSAAQTELYGIYTTSSMALTTNGNGHQYGVYVADGTSTTTGSTDKYGIYVAPQTGADANYGAYFGSSVGIGTTTPTKLLQVHSTGSDSQVYVSSVAPSIRLGNNATYSSLTQEGVFALGTGAAQYLGGSGDLNIYTGGSGAGKVILGTAGAARVSIATNGDTTFSGSGGSCTITGAGACSSDARLKRNVSDFSSALDKIMSLRPVTYQMNPEFEDQSTHYGFIAQEIQPIFPELVSSITDPRVGTHFGLNYSGFVVPIVKSIQDLNHKVENALLTINPQGQAVTEVNAQKVIVSGDVQVGGIVSATNYSLNAANINRVGVLASLPVDQQNRASVSDTLNLLAQAANAQESRIADLQAKEASTAAAIADAKVLGEQALTQTSSLQDSVASTSATIANLSSQIEELFASITGDSNPSEASPSDQLLNQSTDQLALTPPTVMFASDSATLDTLTVNSQATVSGQLTAYEGIFQNSLKSLGDTFLGKTNIAGDLSVDGTFSVTEGSKVNALPVLYFQTSALAEAVDFFNGLVTITKDGAIAAKEIVTEQISVKADSSAGTVVLTAGETEMPVLNELVEGDSIIILTSETTGAPTLAVADKVENAGFVVKLGAPYSQDIKFSYLIVGQK